MFTRLGITGLVVAYGLISSYGFGISNTYLYGTFLVYLVGLGAEFVYRRLTKPSLPAASFLKQHDPSMDLDTARRVQEALLAIDPPETIALKIVRRCVSATTLGGDFYTFVNKTRPNLSGASAIKGIIEFDDHEDNIMGIAIGDVAGHGVSSALVMALSSGLLGRIGQNNHSPAVIFQRANLDIQKFISQSHISHVTAFYCVINLDKMTLTFTGAGHPAAILLHQDGTHSILESTGIFLGMYPDEQFVDETISINTGDRLLLFTDGIVETVNSNQEPFGVDRLITHAKEGLLQPSEYFLEDVFKTLVTYRCGQLQRDDQTLVVVDIK